MPDTIAFWAYHRLRESAESENNCLRILRTVKGTTNPEGVVRSLGSKVPTSSTPTAAFHRLLHLKACVPPPSAAAAPTGNICMPSASRISLHHSLPQALQKHPFIDHTHIQYSTCENTHRCFAAASCALRSTSICCICTRMPSASRTAARRCASTLRRRSELLHELLVAVCTGAHMRRLLMHACIGSCISSQAAPHVPHDCMHGWCTRIAWTAGAVLLDELQPLSAAAIQMCKHTHNLFACEP
eukprot:1162016-Pelagomonas_calceolata.AAC.10